MSSAYEIEIKLKVQTPQNLKMRLRKLGFVVIRRRRFEANIVFDFDDSRLQKSQRLLRLRTEGRHHKLTYKGAPRRSASYKVRKEIETSVGDAETLQSVFKELGLRPVFEYHKYRTTYAQKRQREATDCPLLVYDETPIGQYVELEGPRRWIDAVASQLGYRRRDYITASYATLHRKYCRQQGSRQGDMVFRGISS